MATSVSVAIDPSQFPENVRRDLLASLRTRRVNHKFHYDSVKQTQKWLALHEAHSPVRYDKNCLTTYDEAFIAAAKIIKSKSVHLIGLGCGGYSSANNGYGAYPECWIGDGGATGGGSGTCGGFVQQAVTSWLEAGGRRLDAANSYQDQVDVGKALNAFLASSGVPRADIFLLSKIGPSHPLGGADAKAQFEGILAEMQVDYVDLLLVHWPWDSASKGNVTNNATTSSVPLCNHTSPLFDERLCRLDTWQGMLDIFATGRARAVGVSNYNVSHFEEIVAAGMPLPALTQNPFHLYRSATQSDLIDWTARHGVAFLGYSPFGVPDYHNYSFTGVPAGNQLQHPYVLSLADKYSATPAQVLIQWQYQLGIVSRESGARARATTTRTMTIPARAAPSPR